MNRRLLSWGVGLAGLVAPMLLVCGCVSSDLHQRGRLVLLELETTSVEHRVRGDFNNAPDFVERPGPEFADDRLQIRWTYESIHLRLSLTNRGEFPLAVRWYEMAFIDTDGSPHRVFTGDLEHFVSGETVAPGPIESGTVLDEIVAPTDYVFWHGPINRYGQGAWDQHPLFPDRTDGTPEELQRRLDEIPTLTIGMFIPVEIDGVIHDYRFIFEPVNVRPGPILEGEGSRRFLSVFGPER